MERLYYYNLINKCNNNKLDFFSYLKINLINLYEFIKLYRIEHPWKYRGIRFCIFSLIKLGGGGSILPLIGLGKGVYLVSQIPKQNLLMGFMSFGEAIGNMSYKQMILTSFAAIGVIVGCGIWLEHYSVVKKEIVYENTVSKEMEANFSKYENKSWYLLGSELKDKVDMKYNLINKEELKSGRYFNFKEWKEKELSEALITGKGFVYKNAELELEKVRAFEEKAINEINEVRTIKVESEIVPKAQAYANAAEKKKIIWDTMRDKRIVLRKLALNQEKGLDLLIDWLKSK
jgi:hypothetical protein